MEYGFIVRVARGSIDSKGSCFVRECNGVTWCSGSWFDVYSRPFAVTPEGDREVQPIVAPPIILVYEGHVDNRREVSTLLQRPSLSRASDGQVLVAAYRRWGVQFPSWVIGEYSYALIDYRQARLVAGRDSLGVRRVYFNDGAQTVRVASSLSLLLSDLPETPEFDLDGVAEYFHLGFVGTERTIYNNVRLVRPGHTLVCSRKGLQHHLAWQPDLEAELRLKRQKTTMIGYASCCLSRSALLSGRTVDSAPNYLVVSTLRR